MSSYTMNEISRQPAFWRQMVTLAQEHAVPLREFMEGFLGADGQILLVGAGSSEYIGQALRPYLNRHGMRAAACGTTDLVTSPESYLSPGTNTLVVSFARSGDSPESLGAILAAEAVSQRVRQLIITCNRQGGLSVRGAADAGYYVINLPDETNDRGFAMTNSFTSMYLTALLGLAPERRAQNAPAILDIAAAGEAFLEHGAKPLTDWASAFDFQRIVYLGTESLKAAAQESGLKMLELTRGKVAALFDSPVGFRHGPKSFVDDETLVVLYLSDDPFARRYELDLLREMKREQGQNRLLAVSGSLCDEAGALADYHCCFGNKGHYENALLVPEFLLAAQMLSVSKSYALQIDPDNPNPAGVVNRVVRGVTIYPYVK